uniref:HTH APSES-type domain-containing protein n=1 Tax=Mycena chlorophos TaxID=658473 RepID=A0ABQ0LHB4_MYCCL|nr:predicted protein [Mycena chlorophos]
MASSTTTIIQEPIAPSPRLIADTASASGPNPNENGTLSTTLSLSPGPGSPTTGKFRPFASTKHQVTKGRYITSNDPRGYIPVYEYPLNSQWIMMDIDDGYVLWTGIWKALGNSKADIVKMVDSQPELARVIRRVRGGYLKIQGTWMPFEVALKLARRVAWNIREDLIPLFGPTFPSTCLSPDQPGYGQVVASSGVRRRARRTHQMPLSMSVGSPALSTATPSSQPLSLSMPHISLMSGTGNTGFVSLQQLPLPPHPPPYPQHRPHLPSLSAGGQQQQWPSRPMSPASSAREWQREREREYDQQRRDRERERVIPRPSSPSPFVTPATGGYASSRDSQRYAPYPSTSASSSLSGQRRLSGSGSFSSSQSRSHRSPTLPPPTSTPSTSSSRARLPPHAQASIFGPGPGLTLPPIAALEAPGLPRLAPLGLGHGHLPVAEDPRSVLKRLRGDDGSDYDGSRSSKRSRSPEDQSGQERQVRPSYSVPSLQIPQTHQPSSFGLAVSPVHRRSLAQLPLPPHPEPVGLAGRDREREREERDKDRGYFPETHSLLHRPTDLRPLLSLSMPSAHSRPPLSLSDASSTSSQSRAPSPLTPRSDNERDSFLRDRRPALVPLDVLKAGAGQGRVSALRFSADDEA